MGIKAIAKVATALLVGATLGGCIDATLEVEVTSDTSARATLTQVMGTDFYAMTKSGTGSGENGAEGFCAEGDLTEHEDGSATCTIVQEGTFEKLITISEGEDALRFSSPAPGLVRVALPSGDLLGDIGANSDLDSETRQMVETFFAGHTVTLRISGGEITETNMTIAADGQSAQTVLPFVDLISGEADLPAEFFAIVRAQ